MRNKKVEYYNGIACGYEIESKELGKELKIFEEQIKFKAAT